MQKDNVHAAQPTTSWLRCVSNGTSARKQPDFNASKAPSSASTKRGQKRVSYGVPAANKTVPIEAHEPTRMHRCVSNSGDVCCCASKGAATRRAPTRRTSATTRLSAAGRAQDKQNDPTDRQKTRGDRRTFHTGAAEGPSGSRPSLVGDRGSTQDRYQPIQHVKAQHIRTHGTCISLLVRAKREIEVKKQRTTAIHGVANQKCGTVRNGIGATGNERTDILEQT